MTDYPYDPELPFVLENSYGIVARFKHEDDATGFGIGHVIDTTPAPKIPADAEFIYWRDEDDQPFYAKRTVNELEWETDECDLTSSANLLTWIGDAEVVVLKRA